MPAYKENNTWTARFYYQTNSGERKQKKKRGFTRKGDAIKFEHEFLLTLQGSPEITFEALVVEYMEDSSHRLRKTTQANKKYLIETKILPFFKDMPINQIDSLKIRKWQNWLLKQETAQGNKLSQTYIKTINNQISAVLNYAVKFYNLSSNPIHKTGSIGKKNADSMQFWTLDEFNQFIEIIKDKPASKMIFNLLFWSGIRSGELLALTGEDFNKATLTVRINKSYARLNKEDIISEPKTPKSKRIISLPEFIFNYLDEYIETLYDYDSQFRLFEFTKFYLSHEMNRGVKNSGVKKIRIHDLRHSHASLLIEMGCSPILIQERLGHEEIETTLQTYSHLYPNKQQDVAKQLNDLQIKSNLSPVK